MLHIYRILISIQLWIVGSQDVRNGTMEHTKCCTSLLRSHLLAILTVSQKVTSHKSFLAFCFPDFPSNAVRNEACQQCKRRMEMSRTGQ